jgi:hypothetical protein
LGGFRTLKRATNRWKSTVRKPREGAGKEIRSVLQGLLVDAYCKLGLHVESPRRGGRASVDRAMLIVSLFLCSLSMIFCDKLLLMLLWRY